MKPKGGKLASVAYEAGFLLIITLNANFATPNAELATDNQKHAPAVQKVFISMARHALHVKKTAKSA